MQTNVQNSHIHMPYNTSKGQNINFPEHSNTKYMHAPRGTELCNSLQSSFLGAKLPSFLYSVLNRLENCSEHQHILSPEAHLALYYETRMFIGQKGKHRDTIVLQQN